MIEIVSVNMKLSNGQEITLTEKEMVELKDTLDRLLNFQMVIGHVACENTDKQRYVPAFGPTDQPLNSLLRG